MKTLKEICAESLLSDIKHTLNTGDEYINSCKLHNEMHLSSASFNSKLFNIDEVRNEFFINNLPDINTNYKMKLSDPNYKSGRRQKFNEVWLGMWLLETILSEPATKERLMKSGHAAVTPIEDALKKQFMSILKPGKENDFHISFPPMVSGFSIAIYRKYRFDEELMFSISLTWDDDWKYMKLPKMR